MPRGVTPIFFEEGYFDSSNVKQRRLVQNKYIYDINNRYLTGEEVPGIFFTNDEGKLGRIGQANEDSVAPIMPGTFYFFVSSRNLVGVRPDGLDNRLHLLNRDNSSEVQVTDQLNQEIVLPWPMCHHSVDGAVAVAEYILEEIRNNSASTTTRIIHNLNDFYGRLEQFNQLPLWLRFFSPSPRPMPIEARVMWASRVRQDGPWDHKPLIRGNASLRENAVWRPLNREGEFVRGYFHKYRNHDYFYDVWSNIHYGYVGRAAGFSSDELLDAAGWEQWGADFVRRDARPTIHDETVQGGRRFDDIPDQRTIELGMQLFASTGGDASKLAKENILDGLERLGNEGLLGEQRVKHICFDDDEFTVS